MIFLSTVIAVLSIIVSLAIPLQVWRTGRLEAPPLDLVSGGQLVSRSSRIWIDTDAACGATPTTDPDDCLAIVWLAANGPNIVGISSSYGNASADIVERTTEALVATMGNSGLPRITVWRGAAGPLANSGNATQPAHAALRAVLEEGPLTILALGPLTNVAAALDGRPDLQRNVAGLVCVMSHRPGHIFHPSEGSERGMLLGHGPIFRDLNFAKDEVAARSVLRMRLPVTLVSYDAARQVRITADDLDSLTRLGPAFAWVASPRVARLLACRHRPARFLSIRLGSRRIRDGAWPVRLRRGRRLDCGRVGVLALPSSKPAGRPADPGERHCKGRSYLLSTGQPVTSRLSPDR